MSEIIKTDRPEEAPQEEKKLPILVFEKVGQKYSGKFLGYDESGEYLIFDNGVQSVIPKNKFHNTIVEALSVNYVNTYINIEYLGVIEGVKGLFELSTLD